MQNIIPLDQIEADVSRAAKFLLDNSSTIPEKVLNANADDLKNFYIFNHLKNVSDSIGGMKLPGLPSVGELADLSKLPLNIFDIGHQNTTDQPARALPLTNLLNDTILDDFDLNTIEDNKINEKRNTENNSTIIDGEEKGVFNESSNDFSFEFPKLPMELPDFENIVTVSKVIPRLIPFVVADYKVGRRNLSIYRSQKCHKYEMIRVTIANSTL